MKKMKTSSGKVTNAKGVMSSTGKKSKALRSGKETKVTTAKKR